MKSLGCHIGQTAHLELALGSEDRKWIFASLFAALKTKLAAKAA